MRIVPLYSFIMATRRACDHEHDAHRARFAPLSVVSTLSYQQAILRFSIRESYPWGECLAQTNAHNRRISFRRLCLAEFNQHNPSDFCTVVSDPEHPARHYATAQTALGGEHFCCRNLRFKGSPKKLKQHSNPFFRRQQAQFSTSSLGPFR